VISIFRDHDDYKSIMAKALADRFAEAFAEKLHEEVRIPAGFCCSVIQIAHLTAIIALQIRSTHWGYQSSKFNAVRQAV